MTRAGSAKRNSPYLLAIDVKVFERTEFYKDVVKGGFLDLRAHVFDITKCWFRLFYSS
jgi:hypothetical protein